MTGASNALHGLGSLTLGAGRLLGHVTSPVVDTAASGMGALVSAGVSGVKDNPQAAKYLGAALLTAPILLSDTSSSYDRATEKILRARQDPGRLVMERDVMASLNEFLEKKAAAPQPFDFRNHLVGSGLSGIGSGAGKVLGESLARGLGTLMGGARDYMFGNPTKKAILDKIMREDRIVADAVHRNPAAKEQILEAYATLSRFAPSLADDVNAVRSFLREVVLGGGHVNYATIKNLVDTEKALNRGF